MEKVAHLYLYPLGLGRWTPSVDAVAALYLGGQSGCDAQVIAYSYTLLSVQGCGHWSSGEEYPKSRGFDPVRPTIASTFCHSFCSDIPVEIVPSLE